MPSDWEALTNIPNGSEAFVCCVDQKRNILYVIHEMHGVLKYSNEFGTWNRCNTLNNLPEQFITSCYCTAVVDSKQNKIYLVNEQGSLAILEMKDTLRTKWKILQNVAATGNGPQAAMINNELHVIGGDQNPYHLRFNAETESFTKLHNVSSILQFNLNQGIYYHRIVLVRNKLVTLGGFDGNHKLKNIHQYDVNRNGWKTLTPKLSALDSFGCVTVINGKFIVILSGTNWRGSESDRIKIYCVDTGKIIKSRIEAPCTSDCVAFSVNDEETDELTVVGYVRKQWKLSEIDDHLFPPEYLLRIIHRYYLQEYIHLFKILNGQHFRINVCGLINDYNELVR